MTRALCRRLVVVFTLMVSMLGLTPAYAGYEPLPEPQLCPRGDVIVTEFPYVMHLEDAWDYEEGPRSCSYHEPLPIKYWCDGYPNDPPTALNVISNSASKRLVYRTVCDGTVHQGGAELYPPFPGPYHVHWHLRNGDWDSAYIKIG